MGCLGAMNDRGVQRSLAADIARPAISLKKVRYEGLTVAASDCAGRTRRGHTSGAVEATATSGRSPHPA